MNKSSLKRGERTALLAGTLTVIFAFLKAIVGFFSGSVVLLADAIHSGADSLSTFLAFVGLRISQKKPTERFPYGFYKAESISSLFISLLIIFAGLDILKDGIEKLFLSYKLNYPVLAVGVAFFDALVMFLVGTYEVKIGKKINSQSLISDGTESRMHIFSSSIVLIGLVSKIENIPFLEPLMGILISIFILKIGIFSTKESIYSLLDVSPNREIEGKIKEVLSNISGISGFEKLRLRKSGPFIFGEAYVKIRENLDIKRAHQISEEIERQVKEKIKEIDSFIVIPLPWKTNEKRIVVPVKENKGMDSEISNHFGRAEYFLIADIKGNKVVNWRIEKNPYLGKEIRAGLAVSKWIAGEKVEVVLTREIGMISLHFLRSNLIEVYSSYDKYAREAINNFIEGNLKVLEKPTKEKI